MSDIRSNTISEGSATLSDYNGRCLRRALDQKVRKLRKLLTADEDITTELDRIVCRLMKLALYTTKERQDPPPAAWMQCKLFDLLTLTEKAIERRRRHFLESYPLNAIEYYNEKSNDKIIINKREDNDNIAKDIVSKYNDVVALSDLNINEGYQGDQIEDIGFDDVVSVTTDGQVKCDDYEKDINSIQQDVTEEFEKNVIFYPLSEVDIKTIKPVNKVQDSDRIELTNPSESNNYTSNETLPNDTNDNDDDSEVKSLFPKIINFSAINNEKSSVNLSVCKVNETLIEPMYAIKQNKSIKKKSSKTKTVRKVSSKIINGQYKIKNRKIKEHQKLRSTLSKPIPNSMINLCDPEQHIVKNMEDIDIDTSLDYHMNIENRLFKEERNISAAEDSLFVGIVTEYGEESIALRRNIGIDPIIDFEIADNEILETVINISKDEDFLLNANKDTENSTSQTIFIYDINEPSTSKGVRHICTDVQCGPDNSLTCATISATTSLTKIPNLFSNGKRIKNSLADIRVHKKTHDFCTCTEFMDSAPRTACLPIATGIKIKDSDDDIHGRARAKCSTAVQAVNDKEIQNISNYETVKERKLVKLTYNILQIEDSDSEPYGSLYSSASSSQPSQLITRSKNTTDNQIQYKDNDFTEEPHISIAKQSLIFGGIHVHSYKERIVSEDVIYQGKWQRSRPLHRVNSKHSQELIKRRSKSLQKKKDCSTGTVVLAQPNIIKNFKNLHVIKPTKYSIKPIVKQIKQNEANKKTVNKMNINKAVKLHKTLFKATSIINLRSIKPQTKKPCYPKKLTVDINSMRQPKDDTKSCKKKDYVPMYIKKKRQYSNADCDSKIKFDPIFKSFDKNNEFFYSLKEEITNELLQFTDNLLIKKHFTVLRSENETKDSANRPISTTPTTEIVDNNTLDRSRSPPSQNSSPCSSPNSVATVRAVYTRNRAYRRESPSSDRSNSGVESENKSLKNKSCPKRYKTNKKSVNKPTVICNKENIPESSKNLFSCKKDIPKKSNCAFVGSTKNVFMAQATTGHSKLQLTPPTVMKNSLKKANTIYDNSNDNSRQDNYLSDALNSNKLLKPNYGVSNSHNACKEESSPGISLNNNIPFLKSIEDKSFYPNDDTNESSEALDSPSNSPNRSLQSTKSSIMSAIRQLIEQKIHISKNNSNDSIISGSETIILNEEDTYNSSFNSSLSPLSIRTVIPNDYNSLESDVESLIDELPKIDQNDSLQSSAEVKTVIATEIDSLSIKSSDLSSLSTSKFSEYYLADNELENTILNVSSVQDIYERQDRNMIANVDGLLAAQAFSGFSVNTGSFVGDRIDNVNLIDSETGSLALGSARQTVSEELFVSGRSSDTYESCLYEDDIYVPNWLFNIISQQPSIAESEAEEDFMPMPIPLGEPVFDVNGNALEPGAGFGTGAGDGRGMHSDQSQDSSGRGTSLSSSATSSGQNEPILIDLSAITPRYTQYTHEPMNINEVGTTNNEIDASRRNIEGTTVNDVAERPRHTNTIQIASDVDADVSSLDTDAIDSDD